LYVSESAPKKSQIVVNVTGYGKNEQYTLQEGRRGAVGCTSDL